MVEYDVNVGNQALVQVANPKPTDTTGNTQHLDPLTMAMVKDALCTMQFAAEKKVVEIRTRLEKGDMTEDEFRANILLFHETLEQVNTDRCSKLLKQCMPELFKKIEKLVGEVEYRYSYIRAGQSSFDKEVDRFIKIF